ncbi:MAG: thiamine diphosphokinase [Oscillospiraceae bacterium]|nr:thiamine diphosphokinase [Oscillospiraceae bacterium]MDY4105423.1 thiamine diphosphokinase [Oscillospiraceae bacterium]
MEHICYIIGAWHGEDACIRPREGDFVIAADGGYAALQALGVTADLVVGDFDSLGYVPQAEEVVQHPVMKDDTDMMLAVKLGLDRGYRNFVLTGSVGGRLDHTLANLQTLMYLAQQGARGILYGEGTVITVLKDGSLTLTGEGVLSVFCLSGEARGVTEQGLLYGLDNAVMVSGYPIGVSNEFTGVPATISVTDGTLIILWSAEKEALPGIIEQL